MNEISSPLIDKIRQIVSTVFEIPFDAVGMSTTSADVKAWDSVGHLNLVLALQEEFSITVPPRDLEKLGSVEAIVEYVPVAPTSLRQGSL